MRLPRPPISLARSRRGSAFGIVILVAVGAIVLLADEKTSEPTPDSGRAPPGSPGGGTAEARVLRVIDGDTIVVSLAGVEERIRYIGVDTPETAKPGQRVECYAEQAARRNEALVGGATVELEFDRERRDRFGRLLAYVVRAGQRVNETLIRGGFARTLRIDPNTARADRLARLEVAAGRAGRGLWSACAE